MLGKTPASTQSYCEALTLSAVENCRHDRILYDSPQEEAGFEPSVPLVQPVPEWLEKGARALCAWSAEMCAPANAWAEPLSTQSNG
jgi:hypothetical protein